MKKLCMIGIGAAVLLVACAPLAGASTLEIVEEKQESVAAPQVEGLSPEMQAAVSQVTAQETQKAPEAAGALLEPAKSSSPAPAPAPQENKPAVAAVSSAIGEPTKYTLGPDDIIEVIVRRHPEFSDKYLVNGEGKIQYKFIGDIEVRGLTKIELKEKLTQILGKYIISPDVEVTILEYRSKVIYVIGEVGAPGKYYMKADKISLREAVVQAGLPTLSAAMRRTTLIRPDKSGKPQQIKIDLYALLYEGKLNLDQDMYPGDVLVVPATLFAKITRIINPVTQPIAQSSDTARRVYTGGF